MGDTCKISIIGADDLKTLKAASRLVKRVFYNFAAREFNAYGVLLFKLFVAPRALSKRIKKSGYLLKILEVDGALAGVISTVGGHISLLFVDGKFHNRGIGKTLVEDFVGNALNKGVSAVTVNASNFACGFYERLGFVQNGEKVVKKSIIYTPMKRLIEEKL